MAIQDSELDKRPRLSDELIDMLSAYQKTNTMGEAYEVARDIEAHYQKQINLAVLRGKREDAELYLAVAESNMNIQPGWVAKVTFKNHIAELDKAIAAFEGK